MSEEDLLRELRNLEKDRLWYMRQGRKVPDEIFEKREEIISDFESRGMTVFLRYGPDGEPIYGFEKRKR